MHNGVRVVAGGYYGVFIEEIITRLRGHHEPQEEKIFHQVLRHLTENASMLEVGCFWSYYSIWFMHEFSGTRRSIVVEPDPANLSVGRENAQLNNAPIEFIQASVGEKSTGPREFQAEASGTIWVEQLSVPDIMLAKNLDRLDVLHCDAQGAELSVVRSCETLFRDHRIRFVVLSTHACEITGDPLTHQRCLALLEDFGGRILAEHDVHESFSGDGLIVAYFGDETLDWPDISISYNRYTTSLFPNPIWHLFAALEQNEKLERERETISAKCDDAVRRLEVEKQGLTVEVKRLEKCDDAVRRLEDEKQGLTVEVERLQSQVLAMYASTSWKFARPVRVLGKLWRRK